MNARIFCPTLGCATVALLFTACEDDSARSDFERRYVLVEIPGFESENYAELLDHDDPNARYLAVANLTYSGALHEAPSEEEEPAAFRAGFRDRVRELLGDEIPKVRAIAAHAPSNHIGPEAEPRLVALLSDEVDAVRVEALASLGKFEELSDGAVDAIVGQLADDNLLVRLHAEAALGANCPEAKRAELATRLTALMSEREPAEQLLILQSLAALNAGPAEEAVLAALQSNDPRFVRTAAAILPGMESANAETVVLSALENGIEPRDVLVDAFEHVATEASLAKALEFLGGEELRLRNAGRTILTKIGTEETRVALLDAYHQLTREIETRFAESGSQIDQETRSLIEEHTGLLSAIRTLSDQLGHLENDPKSIAEALAEGGAVEKRMALQWLRNQALFDLDVLHPDSDQPDFLTPILSLAEGESVILRGEALETLGHSADSRAEAALLEGIEDPVADLRQVAMKAALLHASNIANHALLKDLYERRDRFIPETWKAGEPNREIRLALEEAVSAIEADWMTRKRGREHLEAGHSAADRLLAAFVLRDAETTGDSAAAIVLEFLEKGSAGEKAFAIEIGTECFDRNHLPRLRELHDQADTEEQKKQLASLIQQVGS